MEDRRRRSIPDGQEFDEFDDTVGSILWRFGGRFLCGDRAHGGITLSYEACAHGGPILSAERP